MPHNTTTDAFRQAVLNKLALTKSAQNGLSYLTSPGAAKIWNPRGGMIAGLTGLGQAAYHYGDSDNFSEAAPQIAGDLAQGGIMYGLSQNRAPGSSNTLGTLNKFGPSTNPAIKPQAPLANPIANPPDWRLSSGKMPTPKTPLNAAAKGGGKKLLTGAGKWLGKKIIPGAALGFAIPSAIQRWKGGDRLGAIGEASSGLASVIPGVGWAASSLIDAGMAGRDMYKDQHPSAPQYVPTKAYQESVERLKNTNPPATMKKVSSIHQKEAAASQFRQDIENPEAGLNSDLYSAVAPMVSSPDTENLQGIDRARIDRLKEQMRKGIVGLEYLTGLKRNKGETFYDEHPVQAVTTDLLGKAPLLGAGVAAGGIGLNYLRQKANMDMTQPASMARAKNPQDPKNPKNLLDPEKGQLRADVARVFGDPSNPESAEARLAILDRLNKQDPTTGLRKKYSVLKDIKDDITSSFNRDLAVLNSELGSYTNIPGSEGDIKRIQAQMNALEKAHANNLSIAEKDIQKLLSEAKATRGASALPAYADLLETLQSAKQEGDLKPYLGENLRGKFGKGTVGKAIDKHILPGKDQAIGDVLEKLKLTGANPHYDEMLVKDILTEINGGTAPSEEFLNTTLKTIANKKRQSSGLGKAFNRIKFPLAAGAGIAAGGAGLYGLVKAIQNQMYSDKQKDEWKRTLLKSRGDFDAANRI
jgi:hypothetical protein